MNNTTTAKRNLALAAVFMAASLVIGTFAATTAITQSAYAYNKKDDRRDGKDGRNGNDNGNTITIQKCKQAATQSGFDNNQGQECENLICTHPGENATCVQEGAAVSAQAAVNKTQPAKSACEQCFTSLISQTQINKFIDLYNPLIPTHLTSLADLCRFLGIGTPEPERFFFALQGAGVSVTTANELARCLENAGIVFLPG